MFRLTLAALMLLLAAGLARAQQVGLAPGQVLRGQFVQERHLAGFDAPLRTLGHFVLAPGHGLLWVADSPFASVTAITPSGLVQDVGGSETMRLDAARLPALSRFYGMLSGALAGDWNGLDAVFTVTKTGDNAHWSVALTPKGAVDPATMPFTSITVAGSRFADHVVLTRADGDFDTLDFTNVAVSAAPLSADEAKLLDGNPK